MSRSVLAGLACEQVPPKLDFRVMQRVEKVFAMQRQGVPVADRRDAEISMMPNAMLLANIDATARILADPMRFPNADLDNIRTWHARLTAAAARRGIMPIRH